MGVPTDKIFVGDLVRLTVSFTDTATGALVDPTAVVMNVKKPDGTRLAQVVTRLGLGVYFYDQPIDQAGTWGYNGVGSGAHQGAAIDTFPVEPAF